MQRRGSQFILSAGGSQGRLQGGGEEKEEQSLASLGVEDTGVIPCTGGGPSRESTVREQLLQMQGWRQGEAWS